MNNPLRYTDPSGNVPAWIDWIMGAGFQFTNDMLWGLPEIVMESRNAFWDSQVSAAYTNGRHSGRTASKTVATVMTADGAMKVAVGLGAIPPTIGGGAVCSVATSGACAAPAGALVAGEVAVAAAGAVESAYGLGVLMFAKGNPVPGRSTHNTNEIHSLISDDTRLVREAEKAAQSHQRSLDNLVDQLSTGNTNPGIGTKHLFNGVFEARARDGARVYFRYATDDLIEVLGKSSKYNQARVIGILEELYGK